MKTKRDNTGKKQVEPVKVPRDESGKILPGHSLNPNGRPKGSPNARTVFENFLMERYKRTKKVRRKNKETGETETLEIEDESFTGTRWDALIEVAFQKAQKGNTFMLAYLMDQKVGKATQTNRLEGGFSLRGFELNPDDEAEVDDLFAIETHGKKKNTKNHKGGSR